MLSHDANGFALIRSICSSEGHVVVAEVFARSLKPCKPVREDASDTVAGLIDAIPADVDLLVPSSTRGLAQALPGYRPDLIICNGFPWKLPRSVLEIPRLGAVNIHPSLLPQYRGPLPVHWAIRNGDAEIGLTFHWMDEGFDSGRIILQEGGIPLDDEVVPDRIFGYIDAAIARLLPTVLERAATGIVGEIQDDTASSYARWMETEFQYIDWADSVRSIHNQVRASRLFSPANGPIAEVEGAWVKILRTETKPMDGIRVECSDGSIWIVESLPTSPPHTGTSRNAEPLAKACPVTPDHS